MSHTAQSSTLSTDGAGDVLSREATPAATDDEQQNIEDSSTGQVADKQLYRWKDDGGALLPQKY